MKVLETYLGHINRTGEGDLVLFRDAVLTYCAALRAKQPFFVSAGKEALDLLDWLGVEYQEKAVGTSTVPGAQAKEAVAPTLACPSTLPIAPLRHFRERGFQGTTLFAALVRSSYGPDEEGYFPTKSELGFYFHEDLLREGTARWDEEYLTDCQQFFFEELTPAELLRQSLALLPPPQREVAKKFESELLGLAFLVGEQTENIHPLTDFLRNLLCSGRPLTELAPFLQSVSQWDEEHVEAAWGRLSQESREAITEGLLEPVGELALEVLLASGADLLNWKCTH